MKNEYLKMLSCFISKFYIQKFYIQVVSIIYGYNTTMTTIEKKNDYRSRYVNFCNNSIQNVHAND